MTHRQRVLNAVTGLPCDMPAVQYMYSQVGIHEHGEKLNELFLSHPGDFEPARRLTPPKLPAEKFDSAGRYHDFARDDWGTLWEYRVYGMMGHVHTPAVLSPEDYAGLEFPKYPAPVSARTPDYPYICGIGGLFFERLFALRGFEDAVVDLYEGGAEVEAFLDRLTEYYRRRIEEYVALGPDLFSFGDDYGTQTGLITSPELWRKMIKPRLARLFEPVKMAGIPIHFHSCGNVSALFPDFAELGIGSIWPQLPAYDMRTLAEQCREYGFACALHTDRAVTMTSGSPDEVRRLVDLEYEAFRPDRGGSWFYIEVDTGFPFENIRALVEEIYKYRR